MSDLAHAATGNPAGSNAERPIPVLEIKGVMKFFGGVAALKGVDFELRRGEVHAIVGDNGAGKSTLLKIIAGAYQPDFGQIFLHGAEVSMSSPHAAQQLGIITVFQDLALVDDLDAADNLFLGRELYHRPPLSWFGVLNKREMRRRAAEEMARLRVNLGPVDQMVGSMSGGQRQAIAVARAVAFGSEVIIIELLPCRSSAA